MEQSRERDECTHGVDASLFSHHTKNRYTDEKARGLLVATVSGVLGRILSLPFLFSFICCKDWAKIPAGKIVCTFCQGHS